MAKHFMSYSRGTKKDPILDLETAGLGFIDEGSFTFDHGYDLIFSKNWKKELYNYLDTYANKQNLMDVYFKIEETTDGLLVSWKTE